VTALWQLSATALSTLLARREISAAEALTAHIVRIGDVDGRIRAFTEVMAESASAEAAHSDARRRRGESLGPLDGVPVSVKECFDMAGRATTLGLSSRLGYPAAEDAAIVALLRNSGAVILGRTNLSQTLLYYEARNPLFGQTANPWSAAHTPGGSSGGEAAAIAAGMSPLGIGTDLGGSVRVPCHFCGICGIKPSLDRLPMRGYRTVLAGQEVVRGMGGPMARTVEDLAFFFGAMDPARMSRSDPRVPPLPWQDPAEVLLTRQRVGVYTGDGVLAPSGAVARAVGRAARALESQGCTVLPFEPPAVEEVVSAYLGALSADGGATTLTALSGGPVDPVLEPLRLLARLPSAVRHLAGRGARLAGQRNTARMLDAMGAKSVARLWELTAILRSCRDRFLQEMDRSLIDLLVCPAFATPAFGHGGSKNFTLAATYSIMFNALQMPAGVVPVTRVRADEARRDASRDAVERHAAEVDARSIGLPVGVQIVGRPWMDHVVLAAMRAVEREVTLDDDFPRTPVDVVAVAQPPPPAKG
jgi:fatty acid amide hydrolase